MAPTSKEEVPQWVDSLVAGHKVTVFSKTHCPYCRKAIEALRAANVKDMHVEQIEDYALCAEIQDYLGKITSARSVPRVFVNGKFFGGGDDTVCTSFLAANLSAPASVRGLATGKLSELLRECGAI